MTGAIERRALAARLQHAYFSFGEATASDSWLNVADAAIAAVEAAKQDDETKWIESLQPGERGWKTSAKEWNEGNGFAVEAAKPAPEPEPPILKGMRGYVGQRPARSDVAKAAPEAALWQWRFKRDPWRLDKTFDHEVFATTDDTEVRALFPHAQSKPAPEAVEPRKTTRAEKIAKPGVYEVMTEPKPIAWWCETAGDCPDPMQPWDQLAEKTWFRWGAERPDGFGWNPLFGAAASQSVEPLTEAARNVASVYVGCSRVSRAIQDGQLRSAIEALAGLLPEADEQRRRREKERLMGGIL